MKNEILFGLVIATLAAGCTVSPADLSSPFGGSGSGSGGSSGSPSVGACAVPAMTEQYSGPFVPNPYEDGIPTDECIRQKHDTIILLGCPSDEDGSPSNCQELRVEQTLYLMNEGFADTVIVSGAAVHNSYVEAETLRDLLIVRGVQPSAIVLEPQARHTDENIYYSSLLMEERGWETAWVVSDSAGHLMMTAVCDANCCVQLGRLTVFEMDTHPYKIGHYVLYPEAGFVTPGECSHIEQGTKFMCTNLSSRLACAQNFQL